MDLERLRALAITSVSCVIVVFDYWVVWARHAYRKRGYEVCMRHSLRVHSACSTHRTSEQAHDDGSHSRVGLSVGEQINLRLACADTPLSRDMDLGLADHVE